MTGADRIVANEVQADIGPSLDHLHVPMDLRTTAELIPIR